MKKKFPNRSYGEGSIGSVRTNDLTSVGVNDENEILETAHESARHLKGETKGKLEKPRYGSEKGDDNERYESRRDSTNFQGLTSDQKKLEKQRKPDDRKYMYAQ